PTQALTLMNNEFVLVQAQHFAERVRQAAGNDPAAQVKTAWRIALSREPAQAELRENVAFLAKQKDFHQTSGKQSGDLAALNDLCAVVLNLNEFVYLN